MRAKVNKKVNKKIICEGKFLLNEADQWLAKMRRKGYAIEPKIYTGLYFLKTYNK